MIRPGTKEDIPQIVKMAREFWKHTIFEEEFDPEMVEGMSEACIDQKLMAVLEIEGALEGFACGVAGPLLASGAVLSGTEVAWWVNPDRRTGRNGIGLLKMLEYLAKEQGVKYWSMIFMESSMPRKVESIYKKLGYNLSETSYTKVL